MKTIVFAASKGGVGKTTLTATLAIEAAKENAVAMIDLDPQGSLTGWWNRREEDTPQLVQADTSSLAAASKKLADAGFDYLMIDTPPAHLSTIEQAIKCADLVLVPCQPSPLDLEAVGDTLTIIEEQGKPFAFVINRAIPRTRISDQTVLLLAGHGKVATSPIRQRVDFAMSMTKGLTAQEIDQNGAAASETSELWGYIRTQLDKG